MGHNHLVSARFCRAIVALVVSPWLGLSAAIPPEHLHGRDVDHPQAIVHRHAEAHTLDTHHEGAEVGQSEDRIVWLKDVGVIRIAYHVAISWTVSYRLLETIDDSATWVAIATHEEPPPHGPPRRCLSLRAPPPIAA
jgi:hypothetical protein